MVPILTYDAVSILLRASIAVIGHCGIVILAQLLVLIKNQSVMLVAELAPPGCVTFSSSSDILEVPMIRCSGRNDEKVYHCLLVGFRRVLLGCDGGLLDLRLL